MRGSRSIQRRTRAAALSLLLVGAAGSAAGCAGEGSAEPSPSPVTSPQGLGKAPAAGGESPSRTAPDSITIVADGGTLPDGVYRVEFTDEHLAAHGLDPQGVANNRGVWTTTLEDGQWTVEQVAPNLTDRIQGVYQVIGDDVFWRFHDTLEVLHLRWRTDADGDLHFTQVTDTGPLTDFQFALPWARVD